MAEFLNDNDSQTLESTTVAINRTAKTVKGGRNMSFSALVVVGDRQGSVGVGYGKGRGVPNAIEKAQKDARKNLTKIQLKEGTLPHPVTGKFCASKVRLLPASPGTGVIAGGTVRAVLEMAGVHDCLTKSLGSTNKINLCRAVFEGLTGLQPKEKIESLRGVDIEKTHVEEILEYGSKFMTAAPAPAKKEEAEAPAAEAEEAVPAESAVAVAEAPVEEAPAEEAAPAEESTESTEDGETKQD